MYDYTDFDRDFVRTRVAEFRDQVERRIAGSLTEAEFLPLRLRNGLYLQLHAYMLRVAIPYGTLNSRKLRQLAMIAERWDKGYGHFTTRQNIQFNWPKLRDVPDILDALADVEMHAIQTSGNCIRNVTADHFAGAAADEIEDPRPTAELLRQWSTDHPEFLYLPRKFKIGITGAPNDRAVTKSHDIGLRMVRDDSGAPGYEVIDRRRPRPDADDRQGGAGVPAEGGPAALPRGDPARLQPQRPARQQVQGAAEDPRARGDARGDPRAGRGGVRREQGADAAGEPGARRRDRGGLRAAGVRGAGAAAAAPRGRVARLGRHQRRARTSSTTTRSSRCR